ncbi:MAG TPA: type III pantothenate kinase [Verrucomicrobiota bacterium]|nr:type III pantothenate kinase [Verrucomicrobiota bacterium]HNU50525.1 type III pantothenate kinase [Verrucomicrobiota bacterium]
MILLLDIGNTHTHLGWGTARRVLGPARFGTDLWEGRAAREMLERQLAGRRLDGVALCSVVPSATRQARRVLRAMAGSAVLELTPRTLRGLGIDYPKPETIGPDRLANALAMRHHYGVPSVAIDFGTAVTLDVVNARGCYMGGIIAPGLAAMTDYLHEKTALLPRVRLTAPRRVIGRSTEEAMRIGAVRGYREMIVGLLRALRRALRRRRLPVVLTGGCARLVAGGLKEATAIEPNLTLEGLRLLWFLHHPTMTSTRRPPRGSAGRGARRGRRL